MTRPPLLIAPVLLVIAISGCSRSTIDPPSLARRPAESIDPRLGVEHARVVKPPTTALTGKLAELLAQARDGDAAFRKLLDPAQAAARVAGAPQSERWVAAQQALSALEGARARTSQAAIAIDALAGEAIAGAGDIGTTDLAAITAANDEATAITNRQSDDVAAISARIGN